MAATTTTIAPGITVTHYNDDRSRRALEQRNYVIIRDWEEGGELFVTDRSSWVARDGVDVIDFESLSREERDDVHEILFPEE